MDEVDLNLCPSHAFSLKSTNISSKCVACYKDHHSNKQSYKCTSCEFNVHEECINVNLPSRHKHRLKLTGPWLVHSDNRSCCLCKIKLDSTIWYHCSQCSFFICVSCGREPLIFSQTKAHEHDLHQLPIKLPFTCDACGSCTTEYPCICHQCCFIIHRACISLPRVIHINRHNHRISHVFSLGLGKWICGVCHENINGNYGAYSCLVCSYVVHSKCATSFLVWDGKELEGVPEKDDENEERMPFEVIGRNLIKHFSHEHNLNASLPSPEEHKRCYACTLPLYPGLCYKCTQCDFSLHDECANLPRKKRHEVSTEQLTLRVENQHGRSPYGKYIGNLFFCDACNRYSTGFSYIGSHVTIDVRCASVSDIFKHESHPHWLFVYLDEEKSVRCEGCDSYRSFYLRCNDKDICGGYNLCFRCATLPTTLRHKFDEHPLSLFYGDRSTYFCGLCEDEIYPKDWYYRCNDCGFTLHIRCVFKNLIHSRPGYSLVMGKEWTLNLLPNNRLSRPICYICRNRCVGDLLLNDSVDINTVICCSCGFTDVYGGRL